MELHCKAAARGGDAMSDKAYRIKPLEWKDSPLVSQCYGPFGLKFWVLAGDGGFYQVCLAILGNDEYEIFEDDCDSREDGKAKAEAYYLSHVLTALEEIQ
jgi:hypothetical protein